MKKRRLMLIIGIFLLGISTACAVTIIRAADVTYDNSNSKGNSNNVQGAIDELYSLSDGSCSSGSSTTRGKNLIDYITKLAESDTTNLAYDDTADKNLRYIGADPNNYVLFNDELWRIIGVMNNVKDADGNSASRVKLIRSESIGNIAWNSSNINDWTNASLKTLLNSGDYYNRSGSYSSNGLTEESKSMITNINWNLGGWYNGKITSQLMYTKERGTDEYGKNPTTWVGYVSLFYPSDYGYAVGGTGRLSCLSKNIKDYNSEECTDNNWLYQKELQWTLTPYTLTNTAVTVVQANGSVSDNGYYCYPNNVSVLARPALYLNPKILVTKGDGTANSPYKISFEETRSNDISNASPPKLDEDGKLIPITLANDGKVTLVSEEDEDWYNYSDKKWANAVILIDSPSKTYKEGDTILDSDIESYFVWIPKYKYKLWNTGTASKKAHEIDIVFDTTDTVDKEGVSCKTPMTSGGTGNCNNGEYMTHPAFISLGVDGFWVGKFETGYKGATSTSTAQVNSNDSSKIIIKPNAYAWRSNTVYNFFTSAYNYERDLDSHMMKNTEWGAVAYLSHSKYGIGNDLNINNNSSYKTGYGSLLTVDQRSYPGTSGDGASYNQPYNTEVGYLASTTGNITGVYDMSGGSMEYMASYISGKPVSSGFSTTTLANYNSKYFDIYNASSTLTTYNYRILGDATGELGPFSYYADGDGNSRYHNRWYANASSFVESTLSWFHRGGFYGHGVLSGSFFFDRYPGSVHTGMTSRIVLSP